MKFKTTIFPVVGKIYLIRSVNSNDSQIPKIFHYEGKIKVLNTANLHLKNEKWFECEMLERTKKWPASLSYDKLNFKAKYFVKEVVG